MLKRSKSRIFTGGLALTLCTGLFLTPASAQKLYKWVDEQGNVTYQDQPPPSNANVVDEYTAPSEEGDAAPDAPVTLYSVPKCDACDLVRLLLQKNSVPFAEKNPSQDQVAADELKQKSGQLSVPSLTIGDKLLMGYNSLAIRDELKSAGYTLQDETAAAGGQPENPVSEGAETQGEGQPTEAQAQPADESPAGSPNGQ